MELKKMNINDLQPANYNPRVDLEEHDEEYQKIKRSIKKFGYVDPIIWNKKTNNIVGGH
ncbi:ParB N-terminal domain-containing protein [Staphylococcus pseudintermedius]|nr:ParB N-terminal domain-containing protein [Staphylococcus pseudintermedius]